MNAPESSAQNAEAAHVASVRQYYDLNTERFIRFGQGKFSIHRAVWGPGVMTRSAAMHWVDERIAAEVQRMPARQRVLDLGCGVGASLLHLARQTSASGQGITVSSVQHEAAERLFRESGVADRMQAELGDFHDLRAGIENMDVAFSIEAFVQSANAERFFASAARALKPGGRLVVCDDFMARREVSAEESREVREFRKGWRIGALLTVDEATALAARHRLKLVSDEDLTPYLELGRPRDVLLKLVIQVGRLLGMGGTYFSSLSGGDALQRALKRGVLAYRVLVFERVV